MHFWRYSGFQLFVSKRFVMCPVSMITGRSRAADAWRRGGAGVLDLGGHLLTVDLVDGGLLNLALAEIRNGKMAFTVDGAQAANGVKVAAWTMPPALTKARYVHAKPAEDGLYALVLGLRWVLR